ncbi:hypothetical protein [Methylobacterium sp. E-045]|uniref:hypothetical protein n=1 Tax=Methylobacterium sp. E-045 TaxID=2836575 RepID=UPI001FBA65AF|nr:hypothetical protein [Methylobacterium sp. E-045]MCJ2131741.1 hypothetical protein [Methylobacterium sp. E-045]
MTTSAAMAMANINRSDQSYTVYSESRMMQKVGEDLRVLYSEVIDHSMPEELLRLAARIDEKRSAGAAKR